MMHTNHGVTLIEIIVASVIGALLVGGTLMAFVLAVKISRGSVTMSEAATYAAQTVERFRNKIACDDGWFGAGCAMGTQSATDPLPGPTVPPSSGLLGQSPTRAYNVQPADCDGVGGVGDCYEMTVTLTWNPPE